MSSVTPAEVLVGSLLVGGHQVHELQPGALVLRAQQRAAVGVDAAHPLQSLEEGLPYLSTLQMQARVYSVPCVEFCYSETACSWPSN